MGRPDPEMKDRLKAIEAAVLALTSDDTDRSKQPPSATRLSGEVCWKWNTGPALTPVPATVQQLSGQSPQPLMAKDIPALPLLSLNTNDVERTIYIMCCVNIVWESWDGSKQWFYLLFRYVQGPVAVTHHGPQRTPTTDADSTHNPAIAGVG